MNKVNLTVGGPVWTKKSDTDPNYVFFTGRILWPYSGDVTAILKIEDLSGDIEVKRAAQFSADGVTWNTPVVFDDSDGWLSTEGYAYPAANTSYISSNPYVRFGIAAQNKTGAEVERARVTMFITHSV